jgi:hypothetical protein
MDTKKHVSELLPVYMDGMCTPEEIKAVEEHLSGCDQCRRDLADLRKTVQIVGSLRELEPPEGLWEGIEKKIKPRSIFEIFSLKPLPTAVVTVAVLLVAVSINKYSTNLAREEKSKGSLVAVPNLDVSSTPGLPIAVREKITRSSAQSPAPAMAMDDLKKKSESFEMTPAKDSCGVPYSGGGNMHLAMEKEGSSPTPYLVELQVADRGSSFRRLEALANSYQAKKLGQQDSEEVLIQIEEQQFNDFINELNKLGQISGGLSSSPALGAASEVSRRTVSPRLIRVKFNPAR